MPVTTGRARLAVTGRGAPGGPRWAERHGRSSNHRD